MTAGATAPVHETEETAEEEPETAPARRTDAAAEGVVEMTPADGTTIETVAIGDERKMIATAEVPSPRSTRPKLQLLTFVPKHPAAPPHHPHTPTQQETKKHPSPTDAEFAKAHARTTRTVTTQQQQQ